MAIGCCFAIMHIVTLKDMINSTLNKKEFYEKMIKMNGTSSAGAEYYVALQELIIQNKEVFDEAEALEEDGLMWHIEMTIPFLVAWPYLVLVESKAKGRD